MRNVMIIDDWRLKAMIDPVDNELYYKNIRFPQRTVAMLDLLVVVNTATSTFKVIKSRKIFVFSEAVYHLHLLPKLLEFYK